jgi:hypothetical protein
VAFVGEERLATLFTDYNVPHSPELSARWGKAASPPRLFSLRGETFQVSLLSLLETPTIPDDEMAQFLKLPRA